MANNLSSEFTSELLATALRNRGVFEIVLQHMKFSYLQFEPEKKVWQYLSKRFNKTGRVPTMGQLQQAFIDEDDVLDVLEKIDDVEVSDGDTTGIIETFKEFIKRMKFLEANDRIVEVFNRGDKDKAYAEFMRYAEEFANFTIEEAKFETVFGDFTKRNIRRMSEDWSFRFKVPTLIDELDMRLGGIGGGPETGECVLWLGDSGSGKSQVLVHVGVSASRQGHRVAHFQLEGTREQCLNRYDAAWTGSLYQDVKSGAIEPVRLQAAKKIVKNMSKTDIIVSSEETFNAKTLVGVRRELQEMEKKYGKIDVIIIDYLELLEVGDGINYTPHDERFRQAKLAKGMKMLAMEFNAVVHTATQSSSVPDELKQDPEFVITRAQLSEDKGKIRPFDIFITINQTREEAKNEIMRLHTDKLRDYRNGEQIYICNNFSRSRFYDRKRTLSIDWDDINNED